MATEQTQPAPTGKPPRMIRLKVAVWIVIVLILAMAALWLTQYVMCESAIKARSLQSAENIASAIATFANSDILVRNYRDLQDYCDHLVRSRPIAFVAIADSRGRIVVHTNREFLGKKSEDLADASGVAEASVPVMDLTRRAGTVTVGVRLR